MKTQRKQLLFSIISLMLCFSMLLGTTYAWFTDSVTSVDNIIKAGNLDIAMYWNDDLSDNWKNVEEPNNQKIFDYDKWEPGYTEVRYVKIVNEGNLAFKYTMDILPLGAVSALANVIDVYFLDPAVKITDRTRLTAPVGTLAQVIAGNIPASGKLENKDDSVTVGIALKMREDAGNEYQGLSIGDSFTVQLMATQLASEQDAFDNKYDEQAPMPSIDQSASADVTLDASGNVASEVTIAGEAASATVPAGVKAAEGTTSMTLTVSEILDSKANVVVEENETAASLDVHVKGVAADNTTPIAIELPEYLPVGLNMGNYRLYHVENGRTNAMTLLTDGETPAHNTFTYDPATGDVTLYMATFSEVKLIADTESKWEGKRDYSWYTNAVSPIAEGEPDYVIANADQLAALSAIVGGMDGQIQDSFKDKTVKLVADINLGDKESENNPDLIFYPIGYYNSEGTYEKTDTAITSGFYPFEGTFDGNGNTIANFYQNTWEMKGDHNWYDATLQYYRDGMGLFGKVYGGTVKNLTVENFSSDGEIATTGVIAAYADGATFENVAILNCNPRVYNIGNGGIVGCVGWYAKEANLKTTFTNITVDNSNKISALWGSYDVACGGIVGQYYPTSGQDSTLKNAGIHMENCHVSAIMDVYNDVCGNYQYYTYRYAGMMIGSIRENTTNKDGKTIPDMTGITATGCTVNYGDWNDYYYCEFESNGHPSYSGPDDYKFSRVPHSELIFDDANGNGLVDADERASVTGCKHNHTDAENNRAIYLPFHQLFTGYGWGVNSIGLEKYSGIVTNLDITEGDQQESVVKFESKFTGDFLYRVGNGNAVTLGSLFGAKDGETVVDSGVWVTVQAVNENGNVGGTFTANTTDWTKGTLQFSGTGVVKVTIQDYNFCTPTEITLEVIDATNITSATGTTQGGDLVLLCDVNTSDYVNYWNCTLYGNGFTYSLNGAPTEYNSKQGHGILITKNATLDNLVIVGDVYNSYGAYTNQDYYNAAVDVVGDTTIQNCYISGCAAPVSTRANATIVNSTLFGGTVANLIIKSGTVTVEDVTTANYDDGRSLVGMGIVIHSDATESAKLVLNGTLTQYNFISESKVPSDTYAQNLHTTMFGSSCSNYHFGTSPNRYVNAGIISLTALFNAEDITDNANTGYQGTAVTVSSVNGYVYTQPNTSGSVNNGYDKEKDLHVSTMQGTVAPTYSFDYTVKNYVAKQDGSNDYCYEENGKVNISMDEGDTFNWDTSILTVTKAGQTLSYTVSMNGTDYTEKSIAFNTVGDYEVTYTYTDDYNYGIDENGNITTYSKTYTKTVSITVAVIEAATKHAEFTFGSSNTASTIVTVGNNTYVMPNVSATSSTIGSTTVSGQTIYYPIVEIVMSDGKTSHTGAWYAYFPVFSGAVTITDYKENGLGDAETFGNDTQSMPSGLSIVGDPAQLFKYQSSSTAGTSPVVKNNILVYSSPSISAKRSEYNTVIQYSYQDNAGATYSYYIGYHAPAQSYSSICVAPDTLVTLANGTQKEIQSLRVGDLVVAWNFYTGAYEVAPISLLQTHNTGIQNVLHLYFEDGTELKLLGEHGVFDADLNTFVFLDEDDVSGYVGHRFAKQNGDSFTNVKLIGYDVTTEYTTAYTILSTEHHNVLAEGMLTVTPAHVGDNFFNPFDIGEDMKYDEEQVQADIEKYGLYTYEDFDHVLTYEQFEALGIAQFKVSVEKGYITYDGLIYLIESFVNNDDYNV